MAVSGVTWQGSEAHPHYDAHDTGEQSSRFSLLSMSGRKDESRAVRCLAEDFFESYLENDHGSTIDGIPLHLLQRFVRLIKEKNSHLWL